MEILLADDDRVLRVMLRKQLAGWGYEPLEAADGDAAWNLLSAPRPPRLALLDWEMPGREGVEICREYRELSEKENRPLTFLIILTARRGQQDVIAGLDSGAHDFIKKPVDIGELRSRLAVGRRLVEAEDRLRQAMEQIQQLQGLLPICSGCKKIRDDTGYWTQIETYISRYSTAEFSHSFCPECLQRLYPEVYKKIKPEDLEKRKEIYDR